MSYSEEALALRKPPLESLPRVEDRIPFLSLDRARIEQTRTGIEACQYEEGKLLRIPIPFASIGALILGPGSSITSPAITTLHRHGTVIVFGSADGVTGYTAARPLASTAKWALAQAHTVVNPDYRITAARELYLARFAGTDIPDEISIRKLRGLEGHRVKQAYSAEAQKHGVKNFRRNTQGEDTVNRCLNLANSILYGVALSVTSALGLNPGLGVIHSGASGAFLYDLADVYKLNVTVPSSFAASIQEDPSRTVSSLVRKKLKDHDVLERMFELTIKILTPSLKEANSDDMLYDPEGNVTGHTNWG